MGMAKKTINELFDEFEEFIEDCKAQTFSSNRLIVPRDEIFNRIREIRMKLPSEVEKSTQLMGRRDQILKDAHDRAEQIKIVAQEEAQRRIGETEVMKQAMEQAKSLINQANLKAQEIINDAVEESNTIRIGALNYTNNVMMDLSDFTAAILNEEGMKFQQLVDTMKAQYDVIEANRKQITSQLQSGEIPQDEGEKGTVTRNPSVQAASTSTRPVPSVSPAVAGQASSTSQTAIRQTPSVSPAAPRAAEQVNTTTSKAAPTATAHNTVQAAAVKAGQRAATPAPPSQPVSSPRKPMTSEDMPVEDELDELDELYLDQY